MREPPGETSTWSHLEDEGTPPPRGSAVTSRSRSVAQEGTPWLVQSAGHTSTEGTHLS